jgi:hypothetical protein
MVFPFKKPVMKKLLTSALLMIPVLFMTDHYPLEKNIGKSKRLLISPQN